MKTINEIQEMLVSELYKCNKDINQGQNDSKYFNEVLGDTSFLLAGLLDSHLEDKFEEWNCGKWIDDSLIETFKLNDNIVEISGIMIWGIEGQTEQWTEPFLFEIELKKTGIGFAKYSFLFGDLNIIELSYKSFENNRNYWNEGKREWKYIINCNNQN